MKALSIRQPWAWLIAAGHKPIENRAWSTAYRGELFIHASATMSRLDYDAAVYFINHDLGLDIQIPRREELKRGGIVGVADLHECIPPQHRSSIWHIDSAFGFALRDAKALPFVPMTGRLGVFDLTDYAVMRINAVMLTDSRETQP